MEKIVFSKKIKIRIPTSRNDRTNISHKNVELKNLNSNVVLTDPDLVVDLVLFSKVL